MISVTHFLVVKVHANGMADVKYFHILLLQLLHIEIICLLKIFKHNAQQKVQTINCAKQLLIHQEPNCVHLLFQQEMMLAMVYANHSNISKILHLLATIILEVAMEKLIQLNANH